MKTVKQGVSECFPAACAALSGQPLADILRAAAHVVGIADWQGKPEEWHSRIWSNPIRCNTAFSYLCSAYLSGITLQQLHLAYGSTSNERELPPGRGVVTFIKPGLRHILAYADGMLCVSDVGQPDYMTLSEYLAATGFEAEKIISELN